MRVCITGVAGFIGFNLAQKLAIEGYEIISCDDINDYYDIDLKIARLNELGFCKKSVYSQPSCVSTKHNNLKFYRGGIDKIEFIENLFNRENFDIVINLAAQAGVRYSINNPHAYVNSNITGFLNILETSRKYNVSNICYASSSSVYGLSKDFPLKISMKTDSPKSIYAASKKTNELFAETFSSLYDMTILGMRFFTVYGPWGRPDMAYFKFTKAAFNNECVEIYNHGDMERDFTYIDDITDGIASAIKYNLDNQENYSHEIFNLGNSAPEKISSLIASIEQHTGSIIKKNYIDMQLGDVKKTFADISKSTEAFQFCPKVNLDEGIKSFVNWYREFY